MIHTADPSTFRSLASTRPGGRRQHRSHEPPPSHEKEPALYTIATTPGDSSTCAPGSHDNPARNRPRGRAIPPGVAAGPSKLPMTSPSAGRTTATVRCSTATPLPIPRAGSSCPTGAPNNPQQHRTPRLNPTPDAVHRGCHRHRRCRCTYPPEWLGTAPWAGTGRRGFGSRGPAAPGATAAVGGVGYFSCSRAAVRKMAPRRWVNSAWVVTSVVNQSSWLPSASFFSASTTDSSAAW